MSLVIFAVVFIVGIIIGWFAGQFWSFHKQMRAYFGKDYLWKFIKEKLSNKGNGL